ncbi:MFS transporter [Priestia megaterium]|uniref:MFS transporter n=1 Tax=Priestia megaterium TaxID=1404 RepID=UPI003000158F
MDKGTTDNNKKLRALSLGGFLVNADNRAITPMLPAMAVALNTSSANAALLVTAYSIPYGVCQLFYGPLAEKFGKITTILLSLCLFAIGTIICGMVHAYSWLLVFRILTGVFAAGIIPTTLAQIGDWFERSERPRAIAFFMSVSTTGQALGIVIGGLVAQFFSYRILFILLGLACIPSIIAIYRERERVDEKPIQTESTTFYQRYIELFRNKKSWQVYGLVLCEGLVFYGGFTFLGVYGVTTLHLSYLTIGLLTATYSVGAFFGSKTISKVLSHIGTEKMPMLGSALMIFGFGVIWGWQSVISLTLGFIILGLGFSYCHSTLQTFATDLLPKGRATAVSVFAFSLFLGSGLGPVGLGKIFDTYSSNVLLGTVTIGSALFCCLCMTLLKKTYQQNLHT